MNNRLVECLRGIMGTALEKLLSSEGSLAVVVEQALPPDVLRDLYEELCSSKQWFQELWVLDEQEEAHKVGPEEFFASNRKFSNHDSIHESRRAILPVLTSFQEALASEELVSEVSSWFDAQMRFISLDVARYSPGTWLAQHADLFGGRVLGAVFFISPGWSVGCGGELFIWNTTGQCREIQPIQGSVALFPIHPLYSHAVTKVWEWERVSLAAHFGIPEDNPTRVWQHARDLATRVRVASQSAEAG
jgi:hypothetical protein